jgi:hypothetical protein
MSANSLSSLLAEGENRILSLLLLKNIFIINLS